MKLVDEIAAVASMLGEVRIMEVCGGHTNTVMQYGLRNVIPKNIKLISGPGCPVCVTSQRDIDSVIALARQGVKIATYGDMVLVPGTQASLKDVQREGGDVQTIYSIDQITEQDRVFFAVGFETTTPMTARLLERGVPVFSAHKVMPPVMRALTSEMRIDGFIDPGHVSTIVGSALWEQLDIGVPQVIAGFKPEQLLKAILTLLRMIKDGRTGVVNEYPEVVSAEGNLLAKSLIEQQLKPADAEWRGIGVIPNSGLVPRNERLDARLLYADLLRGVQSKEDPRCKCGEIVRGLCEPKQCALFGNECTPEAPKGACMVSGSEGACAIAYKYGRSLSE
ncbi:hydrogenase formation protein HypD [Candidatus Woesearchaeota archaeon]|nr:MAG: hydrogenase formation protein HypD [Candidatus Woesearchaeota archaeon]